MTWTLGVLAGGESRRLGRDKALVPFGSSTLIEWCIQRLSGDAMEIILSTRSKDRVLPTSLDSLRRVGDDPGASGPLAGVLALLRGATTPLVAVVPCDMPWLHFADILPLLQRTRRDDLDRAFYAVQGRREPLPLVLNRRVLPALVERSRSGDQAILSVNEAATGGVPWSGESAPAGTDPRAIFRSVNTVDDLRAAEVELLSGDSKGLT